MGLRSMEKSDSKDILIIRGNDGKTIDVKSFCMSCKATRPVSLANEALIGVVIYSWKGQTEFHLNGVHCKSGYMYIRRASELDRRGHWYLINELFGNYEIDNHSSLIISDDFVATGFSIKEGTFKFKSGAFNGKSDNWRDGSTVGVPVLEEEYIRASVNQWVALKGSHSAKIFRVVSKVAFPIDNKDIEKTVIDIDKAVDVDNASSKIVAFPMDNKDICKTAMDIGDKTVVEDNANNKCVAEKSTVAKKSTVGCCIIS